MALKLNCRDLAIELERLGKDYDKRITLGYCMKEDYERITRSALVKVIVFLVSKVRMGRVYFTPAWYWAVETLILTYIGSILNNADGIFEFNGLETKLQGPCLSIRAAQ